MGRILEEVVLCFDLTRRYRIRQSDIADRLGVTEAAVSMWANGKRAASPEHLAALRDLRKECVDTIDAWRAAHCGVGDDRDEPQF